MVELSRAGDHVPEMPLLEVAGKGDKVPPTHIGATAVKTGVVIGFTVMVSVCVIAH